MKTAEDFLKTMIGELVMTNALLAAQIEAKDAQIKALSDDLAKTVIVAEPPA